MVLDQVIVDEVIAGQIDLLRYEASVRKQILQLLEQLRAELLNTLTRSGLTSFNQKRTEALLREASSVIDNYYAKVEIASTQSMGHAASVASKQTAQAMLRSQVIIQTAMSLPTSSLLERIATRALILGAPSKQWWAMQAKGLAFKFANAVRQGMVAGDTTSQIVSRVVGSRTLPGVLIASRSDALSLVHASIQAAANAARMATMMKNASLTQSVIWLATLDSHTCEVCGARDRKEYTLAESPQPIGHAMDWEGGPGAIHWGCRCVFVPKMKTRDTPLSRNLAKATEANRPSADGEQKPGTSFESWLSRRTIAQQDEQLGKGRAQMWRDGKLSLSQMFDLSNRPLSLTELQKRY